MTLRPPSTSAQKILWKDRKHDHFWIENGSLCESYRTIRGLRWRWKAYVGQEPDHEKISDTELQELGFTIQSLSDL